MLVTLAVIAENDAPIAAADSPSTAEDMALVVAMGKGLLGNDTDVDGDALFAFLLDEPTNGSVSLTTNGALSYTPDADFNGTDTFTYEVRDGELASAPATVSVGVTPVNDAPTIPVASSPAAGVVLDSGAVAFTWSASIDVDADAIAYRLQILQAGAVIADLEAGGATEVGVASDSELENGSYEWRVEAFDANLGSGFSPLVPFEVETPGGGGGCSCSIEATPSDPVLSGALTALLLGWIARRRATARR